MTDACFNMNALNKQHMAVVEFCVESVFSLACAMWGPYGPLDPYQGGHVKIGGHEIKHAESTFKMWLLKLET